jgi:hypothetical protein
MGTRARSHDCAAAGALICRHGGSKDAHALLLSMSRRLSFFLGAALSLAAASGAAEAFLRLFPPEPQWLGVAEQWSHPGLYERDDDFAVTYRSWPAFRAYSGESLERFLPFGGAAPLWAVFGNSFVQAPGMLADTLRARAAGREVFHLGRNEHLALRLAQIDLLLENGLRPERVLVALAPVDLLYLGEQPLHTLSVAEDGTLTYTPRWPDGALGEVVRRSAIARAAWLKVGRHRGNPDFRPAAVQRRIDAPILADLRRLFGGLARRARSRGVAVTIVLIPVHEQIVERRGFLFQEVLGPMLRQLGYDVFDPRRAFQDEDDPAGLYAADKHLSPRGNDLLASELLAYLGYGAAPATARTSPP